MEGKLSPSLFYYKRKYDTDNPKPFNDLLYKPLNENGEVVTLNASKNKPLF